MYSYFHEICYDNVTVDHALLISSRIRELYQTNVRILKIQVCMGPKRDHSATRYPVELIYLIKLTSIIADYQAKTFHRFYTLKYFMCLIIVQIIGLHR